DIERSKLVRTIDDVVWTAVREGASKIALPDGRNLIIGGEVPEYGDEYADPWVYNDVIVTHPDNAIDILTYPKEVFPHLSSIVGTLFGHEVYLFGIVDGKQHRDRSRDPAVLRLDTSSYEVEELSVPIPPVDIHEESGSCDGNRIVFSIVRRRRSDPKI